MAEPQDAKPSEGTSADPAKAASEQDLPVVEAPRLDGSEEAPAPAGAAANAGASAPGNPSANAAALSRSLRFALLAASVAFAAALGSFVGSLSASGVARLWPGAAANSNVAEASAPQASKLELAELSALKASLDGAARNASGQFAKLADRLDHIERAQAEPATKIAHVADAVDRLEKKALVAAAPPAAAAPETTGSIANSPAAAPSEVKPTDKILQDWVVQNVHGGHVLVASRYGGVFEVMTGAVLPGVGRIEAIKRQDGQWVVITASGRITER
jgi:hypothetical protein